MGRKRVKHELISKESARNVTFKKRKAGLKKKLSELTTLCGVVACAIIICSSFDHQLEIWPSAPEAAQVLDKFNNLPTKRKGKYRMDQILFLSKNISNLSERVQKQRRKNRGFEMDLLLTECLAGEDLNNFNCLEDLRELDDMLEEKIKLLDYKIECEMGLQSNPVSANNGNKCTTKEA